MACPTAPYREEHVAAWIREFAARNEQVRLSEDADGNLHLRRKGVRASRAPLVFNAHMDHPGFRALRTRRVEGDFRVDALFLGGVRPEYFAGARVRFYDPDGGSVRATVQSVRPDKESGHLRVRLAAEREVAPASLGMWDLPPFRAVERTRGTRLVGRVADDLAGAAGILALFERIDAIDPKRRVDVRAALTRAEEVGFIGALAISAHRRLPEGARIIAVEASKALPHAPQGAGPIVRVGDRSSVFDDGLTRWIDRVAADLAAGGRHGFRYQRRLMDGGTCESTAYQQYGYRSTGVCLALANYHNMSDRGTKIAAEAVELDDLVGLVRLFEGLVRRDQECPRRGGADPMRRRLDELYRGARRELRESR